MNRLLIAVVVSLMGVGCAVGVDEPEPAPERGAAQERRPPVQTFSAELGDGDEAAPVDVPAHDIAAIPQFERPTPGE